MTKKELLLKVLIVEQIASASKFKRMIRAPFKYVNAILFRELLYKRTKKEKEVISNTFFNHEMYLLLPSSTDIYLTGGKSHESEIRLAKFLINHLTDGDVFMDVGAHYGYFSLLASSIVGNSGKVYAFEASPTTYKVLKKNELNCKNIKSFHLAVSDKNTDLIFYEFPNLYSEYNTLHVNQFEKEDWFSAYKPRAIKVRSVLLSEFLSKNKMNDPKIIKIDVEGAEFSVVNGLKSYLPGKSPLIVMEYLSDSRGNKEHVKAEKLLNSLQFTPFLINNKGELEEVKSIAQSISSRGLESDNIVFAKS